MPSESGPQHRAMEAAAHGNSTLGIPKKVGKEFADADKKAGKKFSGPEHKAKAKALREHKPKEEEHTGQHGPDCPDCAGLEGSGAEEY